jgi:hypothetical protein
VAKKKQRIKTLRRQQARFIKEGERIAKPWRLAIFKLREQLEEDCLTHAPERRHLQNRRLIDNLHHELELSDRPERFALIAYWLFCGSPWQDQLGYEEARRQHYAELRALGVSPEFDRPQFQTKPKWAAFPVELLFRLDSLASWIEAQESWVTWRALTNRPAAWDRHDPEARRKAMDAGLIAKLPAVIGTISDSFLCGVIEGVKTWSKSQWAKVLKMASHIAERGEEPVSEFDTWVWWRYPVFMRYHWSAAEVCRAAEEKFQDVDKVSNARAFQAAWVRRGLRFRGRKTRRKHPPLWDFVLNEEVPRNVSFKRPMLMWIPHENSSSQP